MEDSYYFVSNIQSFHERKFTLVIYFHNPLRYEMELSKVTLYHVHCSPFSFLLFSPYMDCDHAIYFRYLTTRKEFNIRQFFIKSKIF